LLLILKQKGQAGLKDNKPDNNKLPKPNSKIPFVLLGLFVAVFLVSFGYELIQFALMKIFGISGINTRFYYIWFSANLTDISKNIYLNIPVSFLPFIVSIFLIEFSNTKFISAKINSLSILVFQLLSLTYLMLKVIVNAILPLILTDYINDISVVLKYFETSNSLKYLNVLFIVFIFIIYFNKFTIRLTKKVQSKDRSSNDQIKK